jgi:pilus assembly protein Flp/PilA
MTFFGGRTLAPGRPTLGIVIASLSSTAPGSYIHQPKRRLHMTNFISRFAADESGATAIEYGLIAALISVAIIAAATTLGSNISATFTKIADNVK